MVLQSMKRGLGRLFSNRPPSPGHQFRGFTQKDREMLNETKRNAEKAFEKVKKFVQENQELLRENQQLLSKNQELTQRSTSTSTPAD